MSFGIKKKRKKKKFKFNGNNNINHALQFAQFKTSHLFCNVNSSITIIS